MYQVYTCLMTEHNFLLVALAAVICLTACLTTSFLSTRTESRSGKRKYLWFVAVALVFGSGVWATHFVAMMAYDPGVGFTFSYVPTFASLVIAFAMSFGAFALRSEAKGPLLRLSAATVLGLGISLMHYMGMKGINIAGIKEWDTGIVATSITLSMIFSVIAFEILHRSQRAKGAILGALSLVLAVCSLHFTGMGALTILPTSAEQSWNLAISHTNLATLIGLVSLAVIQAGFAISYFDLQMDRTITEKQREITKYKQDYVSLKDTSSAEILAVSNLLSHIIENTPTGVLVFDKDKKFVTSNKIYRDQMPFLNDILSPGLDLRTFVTACFDDHYGVVIKNPNEHPDIAKTKEDWIEARMAWYETASESEYQDACGWIRAIHRRLSDGTYIGLRIDITDSKARETEINKARIEAETANIAKSQFLATMSHEIRTPMNGILGMAQLLQNADLPANTAHFVDIIMTSGESLMRIINDVLDFSKIDSGELELEEKPFSLREAIGDITSLLSSSAKDKELDLITNISPNMPDQFIGDAGRMRQILTNLIGNAIKFTDKGHVIVNVMARCKMERADITIQIEDTGIGIPEDKVSKIFKAFSQVDQSYSRAHDGSGLGLSIVQKIIQHMNGTIKVESEVNAGSVFTITLPLQLANTQGSFENTEFISQIQNANILLLDGNPQSGQLMKTQISDLQGRCVVARTFESAAYIIKQVYEHQKTLHVIIINSGTFEFDEATFVSWMKSNPAYIDIPLLLLQAVSDNDVAIQSNVNHVLAKPVSNKSLHDAIAGLLPASMANRTQAA